MLCFLDLLLLRDELEGVMEAREERVDFSSMQSANMKIVLEQNKQFRKGVLL